MLFLLHIDDLRSVVPQMVKVALFADDVSLLTWHHKKTDAEAELWRAVTAVASKEVVLSVEKSPQTP